MFTIDGVAVRSRPITMARLYCGCITFVAGHGVQLDALAWCPEPGTCPGTQQQPTAYGSLRALTAVQAVLRTHLVG